MRLNKNLGFTLPEVIVAVVMTTITVGGVMMIVSDNSTKNVFKGSVLGTSACLTEAQRILSGVKEKGALRARITLNTGEITDTGTYNAIVKTNLPLLPTALSGTAKVKPANDAANSDAVEAGIAYATRWPDSLAPIDMTSTAPDYDAPILRPHMLVMGYMTTLQSIYNAGSATYCGGGSGKGHKFYSHAGGASTAFPTIFSNPTNTEQSGMTEIEEYIKIEPFNTQTGAVVGGCPSVEPRPPRQRESQDLQSDLQQPFGTASHKHTTTGMGVATPPTGLAANRGYLVTATVTFKDRAGRSRECSAQERFQYTMHAQGSLTLTMNDIDTTGQNLSTMVSSSINPDSDMPEDMGGAIVSSNLDKLVAGSAPPLNDFTGARKPIYMACTTTATEMNNERTLNLRVSNTRPGSIMMCRTLTTTAIARTQAPTVGGASDRRFTVGGGVGNAAVLQAFYSTELLSSAYYSQSPPSAPVTLQDRKITGMLYPAGTYYCLDADDCDTNGIPFFPTLTHPDSEFETENIGSYYGSVVIPIPATGRTMPDATTTLQRMRNPAYTWRPCERTQVCGQNPTQAHFVASSNTNASNAYHLTYNNIPNGCDVNIQIAEVDAAYNITTTEFRTYMQEKVPGNFLCYTGTTARGSIPTHSWYFYCGATAPTSNPCTDPTAFNTSSLACCTGFPINNPSVTLPRYHDHDPDHID